jgi:hypothetical protein
MAALSRADPDTSSARFGPLLAAWGCSAMTTMPRIVPPPKYAACRAAAGVFQNLAHEIPYFLKKYH